MITHWFCGYVGLPQGNMKDCKGKWYCHMWGVIGTSPRNVVYGPPPSPEWSAAECPKIPHLHEPPSTSQNHTVGNCGCKIINWMNNPCFLKHPTTNLADSTGIGNRNHWHFASENLKNRRKNTHPKPKSATFSYNLPATGIATSPALRGLKKWWEKIQALHPKVSPSS